MKYPTTAGWTARDLIVLTDSPDGASFVPRIPALVTEHGNEAFGRKGPRIPGPPVKHKPRLDPLESFPFGNGQREPSGAARLVQKSGARW